MHRTLRFLLGYQYREVYTKASLILLIGLHVSLFFGYLKLRVFLVNKPFSLAWSPLLNVEPPLRTLLIVCSLATVN